MFLLPLQNGVDVFVNITGLLDSLCKGKKRTGGFFCFFMIILDLDINYVDGAIQFMPSAQQIWHRK